MSTDKETWISKIYLRPSSVDSLNGRFFASGFSVVGPAIKKLKPILDRP